MWGLTIRHPAADGDRNVKSCESTRQDNASRHLAPTFAQVTSDLPEFEISNPDLGAERRRYPSFPHDTVDQVVHEFYSSEAKTVFQDAIRWNERVDLRTAQSLLSSRSVNRFRNPAIVERICAVSPHYGGDERGDLHSFVFFRATLIP